MIGRMVSAGLKNVAPRPMLITVTVAAIVLMSVSMFTENLWLMAAVGLFHSVMWSCIFTLAVDGLKEYTSKASGVFMMGVSVVQYSLCFRVCLPIISVRGSSPGSFLSSASSLSFGTDLWGIRSRKHKRQ